MRVYKTTDALTRQQGAALFMALIVLLILTVLGVFGMNIARLENLMAGNAQFQTTALNNAEYTLSRGIEDIQSIAASGLAFPSSGNPYHDISDSAVHPENFDWSGFTYESVDLPDTADDGDDVADGNGKYIIVNAGVTNNEGESFSYEDITNPPPGAAVQSFVISAQSETKRGAKRIVQSVVVTDPLTP